MASQACHGVAGLVHCRWRHRHHGVVKGRAATRDGARLRRPLTALPLGVEKRKRHCPGRGSQRSPYSGDQRMQQEIHFSNIAGYQFHRRGPEGHVADPQAFEAQKTRECGVDAHRGELPPVGFKDRRK